MTRARTVFTRVWLAVVDGLVAVGAGEAWLTHTLISIDITAACAVLTRVTRAVINLRLAVLSSVTRMTATFVPSEFQFCRLFGQLLRILQQIQKRLFQLLQLLHTSPSSAMSL